MIQIRRTFILSVFPVVTALAPAIAQQSVVTNRGVVELETAGTAGISVRIGEELANLIDDGATRRLVPVVGKGALQNLIDLKYLRGIDIAILPVDVLDYAREQKLISATDPGAYYITKLYNEEFHLLARGEIKTVTDLANRKLNVGPHGSGTAITTARLFEQLKIPVTLTNEPQEVALEALRKGQIAAVALVAGKPAPLIQSIKEPDLHLVDIPFYNAAGGVSRGRSRNRKRDRSSNVSAIGTQVSRNELRSAARSSRPRVDQGGWRDRGADDRACRRGGVGHRVFGAATGAGRTRNEARRD